MKPKKQTLVKAIDLDAPGGIALVPESEIVEVEELPLADDGKIIPATLRSLGGYTIHGLKRIEKADPANDQPYPYVVLECEPYPRWGGDEPTHWNKTCGCYVRNEHDAHDALFSVLTVHERAAIEAAVRP